MHMHLFAHTSVQKKEPHPALPPPSSPACAPVQVRPGLSDGQRSIQRARQQPHDR